MGLGQFFSRRSQKREDLCMRLVNRTRNTEIATGVEVADSGARRSKGLLGRGGLEPGTGIWIVPCEAVHTFGMKFSIDLVYLDRGFRIRKLCKDVRPWRLSACLRAHSVVELPAGALSDIDVQVGDVVEFVHSDSAANLTR
jgi:uncharacterized protein